MMRKLAATITALALAVGMAGTAAAHAPDGFDASPAWTNDYGEHYVHMNGVPRFDWTNHRLAIDPTQPGQNSASNSAVAAHGDDSLVSFGR